MLELNTELQELYKSNNIPKAYDIYIPDLDMHISTPGTNDKIVNGTFELVESLCSDKDLRFGSCEASEVRFIAADISQDLKGEAMSIDQGIGGYTVPFGKYKIDSCKKQDDLRYKEIIAYDKLASIDIDVSAWYNSLTFPLTLAEFRSSLLTYLGIDEVSQTLANDDMVVTKTIEPTQISGRTVLEATVELNGAFGHINRQGNFTRIILEPAYGLYPSETLYPSEDLYPVAADDTTPTQDVADTVDKAMYQKVRFEEYTVKEIDKLIIRTDEDDVGAIVGEGSNAYIIEGNFLVYGKSAEELEAIAENAFSNIQKRPYRPYQADCIGLPYLEVGDSIKFSTDDEVNGYILQRTLTGIQALRDSFGADGSEELEQNFGVNKQLIQLQGKATKIQKDVDGVSVEVSDLAAQTAASLSVLAGQVELKVDASGVISAINLSSEGIKITASNISLEGIVTANNNFKVLPDGSIEAVNGKFSGTITGSTISGSAFVTTGSSNTTTLSNGIVYTTYVLMSGGGYIGTTIHYPGGTSYDSGSNTTTIQASGITAPSINTTTATMNTATINTAYLSFIADSPGSPIFTPIHAGNIASQSVAYAANANKAATADYATGAGSVPGLTTNKITASDTGYGNIDFLGFDNAAGVNWVQANFEPITTSDVRLKCDMKPLDLPDELFYSLKPYQFRFKPESNYREGIRFGLIAQQVENAFENYGLNPRDYDIIDVADVRKYTDDGYYVKDKTHRLNDKNLIAWIIDILKKQKTEIENLKTLLKLL